MVKNKAYIFCHLWILYNEILLNITNGNPEYYKCEYLQKTNKVNLK